MIYIEGLLLKSLKGKAKIGLSPRNLESQLKKQSLQLSPFIKEEKSLKTKI